VYELLWWGVTFGPKGVISYFWCYMPQRVSAGLMYVFSLVSHVLSGTLACVSSDHGATNSLVYFVKRFALPNPTWTLRSVYPSAKTLVLFLFFPSPVFLVSSLLTCWAA